MLYIELQWISVSDLINLFKAELNIFMIEP